jgi:hypothetical protein
MKQFEGRYVASLGHISLIPRGDMSLHSDTLVWFLENKSLILLLNDGGLADKQHIPIL